MYICKYEILADFNLVVAKLDNQTTNFSSILQPYSIYNASRLST